MPSMAMRSSAAERISARRGGGRTIWGIRFRILFWYVLILGLALSAAVFVVRRILIVQLEERIDAALVQEISELRRLTRGRDPLTGERFHGDVRRIFAVFLDRNIPQTNETYLTFLNGDFYKPSFRDPPYRLDKDPLLEARWNDITVPDRGHVNTPAGEVEYLAVPVSSKDGEKGVFVAAFFHDLELAQIQPAVIGAAGVGIAALLVGSILAWQVAEGVLRPVRLVTSTARRISETTLSGRIAVQGRDEISLLGATFNEMLDRLEQAFAAQRQFIDDAGHELRTPITVIRGHLELVDEDPEERQKTIALVTDELERMSRIVNDLIILAKAERPDFLQLDTVDLATLTEEVLAKARGLAARDWRLEQVARGLMVGDRQRLTQALIQLAQNAAAQTTDGDPIVLGSALRDGEVRLWVQDSGPGIPPEDQERIFRRFSRGRGGRRSSESAGLGLAIVRAIAEAHHGRVEVESRPGEGATFTVVIPPDQPPTTEGEGV
jgi:two-component system OmpR family sensor kinase